MNNRRLKKAIKRIKSLPRNKFLFYYISNKFKHLYLKLTKSTKVAYPSTIMLELTNHCNLACTICPREYDYGKEMDKGMMDIDNAKKIIDELYPYLDSIGLTGMGETFLYKQLSEVVDYIKDKNEGIIISVSTNAVLPNFIEKIEPIIDKIDTIQISIDGLDAVYDSIRINSNFETLDKNIQILTKLCKQNSTDIMLNMVVTKENYTHMPPLVKYAEKCGIDYINLSIFNLASVTDYPLDYYTFYESQSFIDLLSELEDTIAASKNVQVTERTFKAGNSFQNCPFPWSHFYISQDSFVLPCCAKPFPKENHFGNIQNSSVIETLNSNDFRKWRSLWQNNITPDFCNKCHYVNTDPIEVKSK